MIYRIVLQRLAAMDLDEAFAWVAKRAPETAARWLDRFQDVIQALDKNPQRCPLARENAKVHLELRECLFGKRPNVFRILFLVDGATVRVLRILRAQRRFLTATQIAEAIRQVDEL